MKRTRLMLTTSAVVCAIALGPLTAEAAQRYAAGLRAPSQVVHARFMDQHSSGADAGVSIGDLDNFSVTAPFVPPLGKSSRFATPGASPKFKGLADSAKICPYSGSCQPPDMALAASTSFVVEAVNDSIAVYGPTGTLAAGFPKNAKKFFGIPAPSPSGCDAHGPFTSEPRAFYDRSEHHFYVAMTQVEGNFGVGLACTPLSTIWIAVSQSNDPTAGWYVYAVDMDFSNAGYALDGTQLGFDESAVYFGGNMFGPPGAGSPFEYDQIFFASKAAMESGGTIAANGFFNMTAGGGTIDTLQPVETQTTFAQRPGVEYLVASENIEFGGGHCATGCDGLDVYAVFDPLGSPSLTGVHITMAPYSLAPAADQPGCTACVQTSDTRISATPVYTAARGGVISFALETAANNGTSSVPGVLWVEVQPAQSGGSVTGATMLQSGVIAGAGDEANAYGATMASPDGSLWVVDDRMSASVAPSIVYRVQRPSDPLGSLEKGLTLHGGSPTASSAWGRYAATSLDDAGYVWFGSEFARPTGDWSTFLGRDI